MIFIFLPCAMDGIVNGVKKYWKRSFFGIEFESSRCCNIACVRVTHRHKTKQFHQSSQNNFPHGLGFPIIYLKLFSCVYLAYIQIRSIFFDQLYISNKIQMCMYTNYAFKLKPTAVWFETFEVAPALSQPSTSSRQKPKFNLDLKMLVNCIF